MVTLSFLMTLLFFKSLSLAEENSSAHHLLATLSIGGPYQSAAETLEMRDLFLQKFPLPYTAHLDLNDKEVIGDIGRRKIVTARKTRDFIREITELVALMKDSEEDKKIILTLVITAHGDVDYRGDYYIHLNNGEKIHAPEIIYWIEQLKVHRLQIFFQSCYSGQFIQNIREKISNDDKEFFIVTPVSSGMKSPFSSIESVLRETFADNFCLNFGEETVTRGQIKKCIIKKSLHSDDYLPYRSLVEPAESGINPQFYFYNIEDRTPLFILSGKKSREDKIDPNDLDKTKNEVNTLLRELEHTYSFEKIRSIYEMTQKDLLKRKILHHLHKINKSKEWSPFIHTIMNKENDPLVLKAIFKMLGHRPILFGTTHEFDEIYNQYLSHLEKYPQETLPQIIETLGRVSYTPGLPYLLKVMDHTDNPHIQEAIVFALGWNDFKDARDLFSKILEDKNHQVYQENVYKMAKRFALKLR